MRYTAHDHQQRKHKHQVIETQQDMFDGKTRVALRGTEPVARPSLQIGQRHDDAACLVTKQALCRGDCR